MMQTPASSRHVRTLSPTRSASSQALTIGQQQQRLHVVTRLAIEGKAKQGENGASIKIYLKISLPMDGVTAGSTIPLFPEENVKILTAQVHPIDTNSVPYNFSSTTSPLLHSAARALNLPARSSKSYMSLFTPPTPFASIGNSDRSTSATNSIHAQTLDDRYTGHILVSGYNVSYVLPKDFPPRFRDDSNASLNVLKRRPSISDKSHMHFMAAVELWVPYICKPPRAPYLLSIPIPRCLSNNIKLRIFPPSTTAQSFASLSSEEDAGSWDLTSDPHVTRSSSKRLSRNNSYHHFADDESSDSSTAGFSEGCGIQGTFPSTDRIRVRWATPSKNVDMEGDGRRRVGVREVKGEMTCVVLGKGKDNFGGAEGVMMSVEYKGTCKGVWFGGVATLLGMDVGLEAKGSDVTWVEGLEPKWSVSGGTGYTGFDTGAPSKLPSRHSSKESPEIFVSPSSPDGRSSSVMISRRSSSSSTTSLLRAPLPATNVAEYSFEGSTPSLTESGTMSSIGSLPQATPEGITRPSSALSMNADSDVRPPAVPLTIHINMNDLLPPSKNVFTFNITGTILVTPRHRSYGSGSGSTSSSLVLDNEMDPEPITLPKFTVFTADTESTVTVIRNEVEGATVEVYNIAGDLREAQTRKTVLQKGGLARCGMDGGRVALRSILSTFARIKGEENTPNGKRSTGRSQTPNGIRRVSSSSSLKQAHVTAASHSRPKRDGPLMIPSVDVTVTPLLSVDADLPNVYAVRVCLPAPTDANSEWLEFGLAQPSPSSSTTSLMDEDHSKQPRVEIASASVEGVPVRFETSAAVKQEQNDDMVDLGVPFEEMSGKEWISWVRVHVGQAGGGNVQVDYVVKDRSSGMNNGKGKRKANDGTRLDVFLPTFQLPVGRLVVNVESDQGLQITSLRSNLTHQQSSADGPRLLHYSLEDLFYPRLTLVLHPLDVSQTLAADQTVFAKAIQALMWTAPTILSLILLACILSLGTEFRQMQRSLDSCSTILGSGWETETIPETTTVTSMIMTSGHAKWWFGEATTVAADAPSAITQVSSTETWSTHSPLPLSTEPVSYPQVQALIPVNNLPFSWPLELDLLVDARATLSAVLRGLGTVWRVCKKIYHYPLDPS